MLHCDCFKKIQQHFYLHLSTLLMFSWVDERFIHEMPSQFCTQVKQFRKKFKQFKKIRVEQDCFKVTVSRKSKNAFTCTNQHFLVFFQWCNPSASTSTWSNRNGVACDDGNKCTRGDTCNSGQCTATPFTCNSDCQFCNGNSCSLKTGFGFVNNKCMCKIAGGCNVRSCDVLWDRNLHCFF